MTIKKLKQIIEDMPDDARIYLDDGTSFFDNNSEVLCFVKGSGINNKKIILQTRNDLDIEEELTARINFYEDEEWDEYDMFLDLGEDGFTLDDFAYEPKLYEWAKEYTKTHSWEGR